MKERVLEIGRDSAWYLAANVATSFLSFVAIPIFTRLFTPGEYGIYSLIATTIMLGSPLFFMWLVSSIVRYYPEYEQRGELDVFYSTAVRRFPHFLALFLLVVLPLTIFVIPVGRYRLAISLGVAVFALHTLFRVFLSMLRARQMSSSYAMLLIMVQFGRYIVGAALVAWFGFGVDGPFWGWLGALMVALPVELLALRLHKRVSFKKHSRTLEMDFVRFGVPMIFVTIMAEILTAADRYMVQIIKGSYQVGLYSVVYNLVSSLEQVMASIIMLGATPVIMKVFEREGEEATVTLISKLTRYFLILLFPVVLAVWVLQTRVISVIASPKYMPATAAVLPLVFGIFLNNLYWLPGLSFQIKKRTQAWLVPTCVAAGLNIGLNLLLIPRYGFEGAAWATLISYVVCFVLVTAMSRRYMRWDFPWLDALKVLLASGVMAGVIFALDRVVFRGWEGLALIAVAGTLVYAACLLLFRTFSKAELDYVRAVAGRIRKKLFRRSRDES